MLNADGCILPLAPGRFQDWERMSRSGALCGLAVIPARWLDAVELRNEIPAISDDLASLRDDTLDLDSCLIHERYPGW
jgi:hypothetical protein